MTASETLDYAVARSVKYTVDSFGIFHPFKFNSNYTK